MKSWWPRGRSVLRATGDAVAVPVPVFELEIDQSEEAGDGQAPPAVDIAVSGGAIAVTNLALAALGFVTSVIMAKYFGVEGRGLLSLVFLWPGLLIGFANLGLPQAALLYASKFPDEAGKWVGTASSIGVLSGFVFGTIGFFGVEYLLPGDYPEILWPARVMMLGLALQPIIGASIHPWLGLGRIRRWNLLRAARDLVPLMFLGVVIALGSKSLSTLATVQVALLAAICALSLFFWRGIGLSFDRTKVGRILAFGLPTALSVIPYTLSFRIDQAFLATTVSDVALGHYAVAAGWSMLCLPVLNTLANTALPRVIQTKADPSIVVRHVRFSVLTALILAAAGAAASPILVPRIYGESFAESGRLAMILLPATAILGLATVMEEILRALHRPRSPLYAQMLGLTLALSTLWWVAPRYGIWGATVVSAVSYSAAASWSALAVARAVDRPVWQLFAFGRSEFRTLSGLVGRFVGMIGRK